MALRAAPRPDLIAAPLAPAPRAAGPDVRLHPRYRAESPLEAVLRNVEPGRDAFRSEKEAAEITGVLDAWRAGLERSPADFSPVEASLAENFRGSSPAPAAVERVRAGGDLIVERRRFLGPGEASRPEAALGRADFVRQLPALLIPGPQPAVSPARCLTAELILASLTSQQPWPRLRTQIRYDGVATGPGFHRAERVARWELTWARTASGAWRVQEWRRGDEIASWTAAPLFADITAAALGGIESYQRQLVPGAEYWRTVLDAASGVDVYGNNGIAVGDIDNDGWDDLYLCQPAGLPNRLYRNRGDGTFEDVTDAAGVGVLDNTPCALFADFDNDGRQELLVVRANGPLLFRNEGTGRFRLQPDAFRFAQPPQGTFTGAAAADYDRDGLLDVYFCLYSYYQGLDQYRFPTPYDDAENGPPNFLLRNHGDGTFRDVTAASGLNQNNHRYSFACAWGDYNDDGWPDLFVANDFGKKNLYRNNGDGTFTDVAPPAGAEDVGAGMSVCWFDYDNDGRQDLYVANMWSAAGLRVTAQPEFMPGAPAETRQRYRKHASGNSLLHNEAGRGFRDATVAAGVDRGRWAWSSDAWDFDHDGYPDLYIANGMISGPDHRDLSSFFWRQVVAQSPLAPAASPAYEQGWNAINELIRADGTWSGYERNVFYANNGDGTFSDVSGTIGLDFADDSRAFALCDFDHDGRLEVFLKNRSGPQIRILRNQMREIGMSIAFRLRGRASNHDAIGATITVEAGNRRQTKCLQAGSGFLSQHAKTVFFGLGRPSGAVRAIIRWPNGATQQLENLPAGHYIVVEEGSPQFRAEAFRSPAAGTTASAATVSPAAWALSASTETWLVAPLAAPDFTLPDSSGRQRTLRSFEGRPLLLTFWAAGAGASEEQLRRLETRCQTWARQGLDVAAVNVNAAGEQAAARAWAGGQNFSFPVLWASEDTAGIYNLLYRYLFDRRRDLGLPTSFLLDEHGSIVKVYQGPLDLHHVAGDFRQLPRTPAERLRRALPFPGQWYGGEFRHNQFTYGVAFFQRGYVDQAIASFEAVVRDDPANADAYYNLGTLYLRKQMPVAARRALARAVGIRPDYADAWNNLGMVAAQAGQPEEAIRDFERALELNPSSVIALQNLGNLYRSLGRTRDAQPLLERALALAPQDPEVNYSLGMLFAQQDERDPAQRFLEQAVALRPDYPEALNNLGVLYLRRGRVAEAIATLERCTRVAPDFDQAYLNLARLYAAEGDRAQAADILRHLLDRHPGDDAARQALEQLRRSSP